MVGILPRGRHAARRPQTASADEPRPAVNLNASFGPAARRRPRRFMSQSERSGIAVIDVAKEEGLGMSSFVSVGNKADLSGNDFLAYWDRDDATDVILLYLESFGNPRRFSRVARDIATRKPIVAVKGGRSSAGARAAGSHTGALLTASDSTVDALFAQSGVVRTDTLGELFDVAGLRAAPSDPPPGDGSGWLRMAAAWGSCLPMPARPRGWTCAYAELSSRELLADLPEGARGQPLDLLAAALPGSSPTAIAVLAGSGAVDSIVVIYVPPLVTDPTEVAAAVREAADEAPVPVIAVFAMPEAPDPSADCPASAFPRTLRGPRARRPLRGMACSADGAGPELEVDDARAAAIIARALGRDRRARAREAAALTALLRHRPAASRARAEAAQRPRPPSLAMPDRAEGIADGLVHRSDAGAVAVGLSGARTIERAAEAMVARMEERPRPDRFLVQAMAGPASSCWWGGGRPDLRAGCRRRRGRGGGRASRRHRGAAHSAYRPRRARRRSRAAYVPVAGRISRRGARGHRGGRRDAAAPQRADGGSPRDRRAGMQSAHRLARGSGCVDVQARFEIPPTHAPDLAPAER